MWIVDLEPKERRARLVGPFRTYEDALAWASRNGFDEAVVRRLASPTSVEATRTKLHEQYRAYRRQAGLDP